MAVDKNNFESASYKDALLEGKQNKIYEESNNGVYEYDRFKC